MSVREKFWCLLIFSMVDDDMLLEVASLNFNVLVFGIRATKLAHCLVFLTGLLVVLRKNASTGVLSLSP